MASAEPEESFLPALRFRRLTRFYDPIVRLLHPDQALKARLIQRAGLSADSTVLDLACGTGTLALLARDRVPGLDIRGLDADAAILAVARRKAEAAGQDIPFDQGLADRLPYEDAAFDVVFSSLFFHHVDTPTKRRTLAEARRVLCPGGTLHIADFGRPANGAMGLLFYLVQVLDGFESTRDHRRGLLSQFVEEAGFEKVEVWSRMSLVGGTVEFLSARRPPEG